MSDQRQSDATLAGTRLHMVRLQLEARGIRHRALLEAFIDIPRERFVPPERRPEAYEDRPVAIGYGQTISQPYVTAWMLEELNPQPGDRVLDVGAGSGYQTAILARLCRRVYAIERIEALTQRAAATLADLGAANITWRTGDGTMGWPEEAPFERIICGAGGPDVPRAWIDQLAEGGRIVVPVGDRDFQMLAVLDKTQGLVRRREIGGVRFVKLIGRHGWPDTD